VETGVEMVGEKGEGCLHVRILGGEEVVVEMVEEMAGEMGEGYLHGRIPLAGVEAVVAYHR
jgi:hypothetical protein